MVRTVVARPASPLAVLAGSFVATTVGAPIGTSLLAITTVAVAAGLLEVVVVDWNWMEQLLLLSCCCFCYFCCSWFMAHGVLAMI